MKKDKRKKEIERRLIAAPAVNMNDTKDSVRKKN